MLQAPIMTIMAQYVKNTDVPNEDSFLWQLGNGWKISQSTGDPWAPINTITDEILGTKLTEISDTEAIDVIDYQSYFFVPNKFISKFKDKKTGEDVEKVSWSVFAFENYVKAKKKLDDIKKFANYKPKTQATTTVPKPPTLRPQGQQTFTSKPVTASTATPTPSTIAPSATNKLQLVATDTLLTTFTDPTPVRHDDKELIATMLYDGFVFLPSTIVERNCWDRSVYDDENNIVGTQLVFLMGRIINVKIPDNE